ncbi:DUF5407 family protein [Mycolicibacterium hodleri]|uniref:Uncharacterized protein n=1 Tax=Mycolicibacterium hodleri TaxID=49897 RepID=A0A502EJE4_9MYCO|nr:DUF5407 family protein [Mycolicibacterium hodleri]TPG37092.1 hypothetical protein EAH80_04330 [Mycolicibacterium hodleri]
MVLAMSSGGGAAAADPDPGAPSPSAPSAASPDGSSGAGGGPTSGAGSGSTANNAGDAPTSVRADEDALSKDMIDLKNLNAETTAAEQAVQDKLDSMRATSGDSVSISDMFQMQMLMNHLNQMSEMSASVVSASNAAALSMARGVKG